MFSKSLAELESDFMHKARVVARMPSVDNIKKAQKAYDKLPAHSRCRNITFEGKRR